MRFPLAGWAWPPGPRVSAAHNSGVDGRGDGREKGPMQAASGFQRDKTRPATRLGGPPGTKLSQQAALAGPPGTKLSQRAPKRRFRPTFRMQGELFTASATNNPSRENFIPHAGPLPVQNSPSKRPWQAHPVQNSPCRPARRPTRYKTLPAARLGDPPGTKLSQRAALAGPPGTKLSQRAPKRRFRPTFRMQGELFTASAPTRRAGRKKSRTNTPPHPNNVPLSKFRMQFDCVSFQQSPETLQSQRSQFKSQNTPRGIACEIDEAGFERAGGSGGHGRAPEKPAAVSAGSGRAKTEQKSHIISCGHFSRPPTNGAIATIQIHGLKHAQGNYVRNC